MKELNQLSSNILKYVFHDLPCGIYFRLTKNRYFLIAANSDGFPLYLQSADQKEYVVRTINSLFVMLFPSKITLPGDISGRIEFVKNYLDSEFYRYYLEEIIGRLNQLRIPYISLETLGSVFRDILPHSKFFLWLREKFNNFYKIIYSFPQVEENYVYISTYYEEEIIDIEAIKDYSLKDLLDKKNMSYVKIVKHSDNIFVWGFQDFPVMNEKFDEIIKNFYPDNFLFLDYFEMFMKKIYPKNYQNFRVFAKDLQRALAEVDGELPLYFKISMDFARDEFYLDRDGMFKSLETEPKDLSHVKSFFGEIYYHLPIRNAPCFLNQIIEGKLNEICFNIFYRNFKEQLKSIKLLEGKTELKTYELENILKEFQKVKTSEEFEKIMKSLLEGFKELTLSKQDNEKRVKQYEKMFELSEPVMSVILKERNLGRAFNIFFKLLQEVYEELGEIVWSEIQGDTIKSFFSSTKLIREDEFEEVLREKGNYVRWKNFFVIKDSLTVDSKSFTLCFLLEKENRKHLSVVKIINLFLYIFKNFKKYSAKFYETEDFLRYFSVKIKVMKKIFSLPEDSEHILTCTKEKIDIVSLIQNVIDGHSVEIKKKNLRLNFLSGGKMFVTGYTPLLRYAFSSLFKEMIYYNRIKGKLDIKVDKEKGIIHIEDTGIGLTESQVKGLKSCWGEKEDLFTLIGEIFKIHKFEVNVWVEKGIGNKIEISV